MEILHKTKSVNPATWWIILICFMVAVATIWWFGKKIHTIDQKMENIEKK